MANKKIVCLGGGIGTVNLIKGLKKYTTDITVVTSMADDGGSSGRLRRFYGILPPGDIISCMAAMSPDDSSIADLLTYRFPGNRYGNDSSLEGHKLGNLFLTAIYNKNKDFMKSIEEFQKIFKIPGHFYPNTLENITLTIKTESGKTVEGEEKIELGKYRGKKVIDKVSLSPSNPRPYSKVLDAMREADAIIVGPGDVYSNYMPVLLVSEVADALKRSKSRKFLIVNVANKPYETQDYTVEDYLKVFDKHIRSFPFDTIFENDNFSIKIPYRYRRYSFVKEFGASNHKGFKTIKSDLLDESFPLYHDPHKLAKAVFENI